jgi:hypothetical protein
MVDRAHLGVMGVDAKPVSTRVCIVFRLRMHREFSFVIGSSI